MGRQILVVLENPDRIEQFLPYIDQVAQANTKLLLLVHHDDRDSNPLMDELRIFHTGFLPAPVFTHTSTATDRQRATEQRIFPACKALTLRGVEIVIRLYAAPVRTAVSRYLRDQEFQMVIMHPRQPRTLLSKLSSAFRKLRAHDLEGVLFIHPSRTLKV